MLNIDESWISDANFVWKKWNYNNKSNSIEEKSVSPRISLIGAIDTDGDVYISLIHANTDSEIFKMYLSKLAI